MQSVGAAWPRVVSEPSSFGQFSVLRRQVSPTPSPLRNRQRSRNRAVRRSASGFLAPAVSTAPESLSKRFGADDSGKPARHGADDALALTQGAHVDTTRLTRQSVFVTLAVPNLDLLELRDQGEDNGLHLPRLIRALRTRLLAAQSQRERVVRPRGSARACDRPAASGSAAGLAAPVSDSGSGCDAGRRRARSVLNTYPRHGVMRGNHRLTFAR